MDGNNSTTWLRAQLARRVDASSLGLFRIIWGVLMSWEAIRKLPKASGIYSPEYFHFKYSLFPFVDPLPEVWMMRVEISIMLIAAILVTAGLCFRYASAVFLFVYTHLFLIDKLYYNNHFYLTILVSFVLVTSQADACYRLRWPWKWKETNDGKLPTVPLWNLVLLRGQVIVLYFFGGVAKINSDWLQGEPVRHWFSMKPPDHVLALVLNEEWFVWMACWGGLLLDLVGGFLLLFRKTRVPTMLVMVAFHAMNDQLFRIGLFPLIAIAMLLLFVDTDRPRKVFAWLAQRWRGANHKPKTMPTAVVTPKPMLASWGITAFVVCFLAFQSLWPLRIWSYGGNPSWTEVGHCFSWRMMLRSKDAFMQFTFDPPQAERYLEQHPEILPKISQAHLQRMVKNPQFILQYVHALSGSLEENGVRNVKIRCVSVVSLNGRPYQLMIDPRADLATASYGFFEVPDWILPLDRYRRAGRYPKTAKDREQAIVAAVRGIRRNRGAAQPLMQARGTKPGNSQRR